MKYPNEDIPMPNEYADMLRYYIPNLPMAAIKDAWRCNATAREVILHYERIENSAHGIKGKE